LYSFYGSFNIIICQIDTVKNPSWVLVSQFAADKLRLNRTAHKQAPIQQYTLTSQPIYP
jgi:hypothetical protein